jgi:NADPH2:quinone reductase
MRALQVTDLVGPDAVVLGEIAEPAADHVLTPGQGVVIDVRAAGVAFHDVLQSHGRYQHRPDPPYTPGGEVSGVVRSAPEGSGFSPGDRVVAMTKLGGCAEVSVAASFMTFPLPTQLDFAQGAGFVLNYNTAYFALVERGRFRAGEHVLVQGGAGGVGTATLQTAKALGARTIAVVSTDEKERVARAAGADEVVRADGPWREEVREISGGGVDLVIDPVGGDRFLDSLRSLRDGGRLVVVGFTDGVIPEVKVNRLLLRNLEVIGAGGDGWLQHRPDASQHVGRAVDDMVESGALRPVIGARFPLEQGADALRLIERREACGKVILDVAG